jgi:hypothetical protein
MGTNSLKSGVGLFVISRVSAMFQRLFVAHPAAANESYLQHQRVALSFALPLMAAAGAALVHALIPGLCERTASDKVRALNARLEKRC